MINALFVGGPHLDVCSQDGRYFTLTKAKCVRTSTALYQMPAGATSDGASTPPELWLKFPPFGLYWPPAFFHDCGYRGTLNVWNGGIWVPVLLTKDQCDRLFDGLMFASGVPDADRKVLYEGVHLLGWRAFRDDRQAAAVAA